MAADLKNRARYDEDFYAWCLDQAAIARAGRLGDLDGPNLAEELEDMGISQRRELRSRLVVILVHLLKWQHQPEARSGSWRGTLSTQRNELADLLGLSPSLRRFLAEDLPIAYPRALKAAAGEAGLPEATFPATPPYAIDDILSDAFLPDESGRGTAGF